ncbi:MAG TPA: NAD(P)-dependent oxidoreductase [Chloroflexota bacterium]|nr:NAD(P)-dependent oxidoreductase [Chloroflexota bacterium]
MHILVTGSNSRLGAAIVRALSASHDVRTLDLAPPTHGPIPTYVGDLRDRDFAARAVADCDAVVQVGPLVGPDASPLDVLDAATRGTYNLLTTATNASRFILISTLRLFAQYPMEWRVTEQWAPRPTTDVADLAPYLAECTVREVSRVMPLKAIALRLGEVVDDADVRDRPADPGWLHLDDAVQAVERALAFEEAAPGAWEPSIAHPTTGWWVFHIPGGGSQTRVPLGLAGQPAFGYTPRHDLTAPGASAQPQPPPPPVRSFAGQPGGTARHVVLYGAGGPLGAVTAEALARDHVLRLTDVRPLAEIAAANSPQSPGAPVPRQLDPPHESRVVDVTDADQVTEAARGMDTIVNCTVVRPDPVLAFRVNTLGAYNVMRAAVACGIRRVVHTGPQQVTLPYPAGYGYDFALPSDLPSRPGANLYILTKFLGQEICRIFAEAHDLEVPTLLFSSFVNPSNPAPEPLGAYPFSISWEDAGAAMRQAVRVPTFPRPFEPMHIVADLPHGKYANLKAKQLLGWQPRDQLEAHWLRQFAGSGGSAAIP